MARSRFFTPAYRTRPADPVSGTVHCRHDDPQSLPLTGELAAQPGPGKAKVVPHDVDRSCGRDGHFFGGHAAEVMHLDDAGQRGILVRQRLQRVVQVQELDPFVAVVCGYLDVGVPGMRASLPPRLAAPCARA